MFVMSAKTVCDKIRWRRRKNSRSFINRSDDDCASLTWLLNFRLDEIVKVKEPEDEPVTNDCHLEFVNIEPTTIFERKPPYTYPELIERALREEGELTVSAIYQWISNRFPYYKANDERWKNSVRHNLSINPHFRKGARATQGAGHLWSLAENAMDLLPTRTSPINISMIDKTETMFITDEQIIEFPKVIVLDEAAIAAANIIPDQNILSGSTMFLNPISSEQVVRECGLLTVD